MRIDLLACVLLIVASFALALGWGGRPRQAVGAASPDIAAIMAPACLRRGATDDPAPASRHERDPTHFHETDS
jgi:hypothetical protein